jgi:serine/threonine-protein kinase
MGSVYVAEHLQTGRRRAVKIMHPGLAADAKFRQRFELEARIGGQIESDHVVEIIDAGIDPGSGTPWLAMELLEGEELSKLVKREGALEPTRVCSIFEQLCHALSAAHERGIVHRDLKPDNIFLTKARRPGVPFTLKVLDFGIAKLVAEAQTASTDTIGSPSWMAPEQAQRGVAITPATDVWALGLIAFWLLTGKVFWLSSLDPNASQMMLLKEVVLDPLGSASERATVLGVAHRLPPDFDAWFARCVSREPAARFATAGEAWLRFKPLLVAVYHPTYVSIAPASPAKVFPAEVTVPIGGTTTGAPTLVLARASGTSSRSPVVVLGTAVAAVAATVLYWVLRGSGGAPLPVRHVLPTSVTEAPSMVPMVSAVPFDVVKAKAPPSEKIAFDGAWFMMGNDAKDGEKPTHRVWVSAFVLDRTEVTVAVYRACVDAKKCNLPRVDDVSCNWQKKGVDDHPIDCVDQNQAVTLCAWRGMRLPTEEEWEYAARGGSARPYPWKDGKLDAVHACYLMPAGTCAVGSHSSGDTPEGATDMAGNVWEWTRSPFCPYSVPRCGSKAFVIRGGSASSKAEMITTTIRFEAAAEDAYPGLGIRCAASTGADSGPEPIAE